MGKAAQVKQEMTRVLSAGVAGRVFAGAVACVGYRDGDEAVFVNAAVGHLESHGDKAREDTHYDLASLTKPVVAMTALRMAEASLLDLDGPALEILSDVRGACLDGVSVRALLNHRSGLDSWGGLYLDVPHEAGSSAARRWLVSEAARRPSQSNGRKGCLYSDLGYIVGGEVVARCNKTSLDQAVRQWITAPLGLAASLFYAGEGRHGSALRRAAPTERCDWRGRVVRGEVHDENCAALGGVAGHAGLFGTAETVARFGRAVLDVANERSDFFSKGGLEDCLRDPGDGASYRLGWDTRSTNGSSAGNRMSRLAFGHLGFTGTSIWCDPERDVVIVLLSNRVHPSRANEKIRGFRPAFHDGVLAVYDRE